jgi:predicted TIM-barrel fold metal-dependent hydrolase
MIVDWHSHWIPPSLSGRVARMRALPLAPEFLDVDARLRFMDAAGIGRQVISWPATFGPDASVPAPEAAALCREFNGRLSELVAGRPERFSGLAALPTAEPEAAAGELVRSVSELGLVGAVLPADAFLTPDGARPFGPILEAAQRMRCHLYVHPGPSGLPAEGQGPIGFLRVDSGDARWLLESGTRLAAAALTLETGGVLDGCPDVSVHVAMLGGHLGWIAETLADRAARRGDAAAVGPLRRIHVDTGILSPGGRALQAAVALFGADRVLFGSDYPQFGTRDPVTVMGRAGLPDGALDKVLRVNSERLLCRLRVAPGSPPG